MLCCIDDACVIQNGWTALIWAAWRGHLSVARLLMEQCVALDMSDKVRIYKLCYIGDDDACVVQRGSTALMEAAYNGHLPIVQYLAEQGAALNMANKVRVGGNMCIYC